MGEVERQTAPLESENELEGPRLSLDGLLRQLVSHAEDVVAARGRLRALLTVTEYLLGSAELPLVLHRIAEAACSLADAGYGALAILSSSGDEVERVITAHGGEARPVPIPPRRPDAGELTVPVHAGERLFGYLHLGDPAAGAFTSDDRELLSALAATAGVVIENAELFDQIRRRERWLEASGSVTRQLLAPDGEEPLALIAREARTLADADFSAVIRAEGDRLVVVVASGLGEDDLRGRSFDPGTTLSGRALATGQALRVADLTGEPGVDGAPAGMFPVGPAMALPLTGASAQLGTLVLARSRGRRSFDDSDLEMASAFANQAAVAVELADARADQQRMTLLEDRDRIARTLHDQVIQRLFAAGLSVQGVAGSAAESADVEGHQQRLRRVVSDIDDTIRQIRTSVFELQAGSAGSARSRLLAAVADAEEALPATPSVIVDEGVELLAGSDALLSDVVAVLREGLSNVARHAGATAVDVQVRIVDRALVVEITDNGAGIGPSERRSGLENLRRRALARAGSMSVEPAPDATPERAGTRLTWTVPVA